MENPLTPMFNRDVERPEVLRHALRQVDDWRSWLRENKDLANRVVHGLGLTNIDQELPCIILIGLRHNETLGQDTLMDRRRAVVGRDKHDLMLHHYDWLLEI